jgi:hypothetical protein
MPPERTSRSSTTRHSVISENTPPHLFKKLNPRLHGSSRIAFASRKRGPSNTFTPATVRSGVYQAELARKRRTTRNKVEHPESTSTTTPVKDVAQPHYGSRSLPPSGDASTDADPEGPYIFKFVRPFDAERADDLVTPGPQGDIRLPRKLQRAPYKPVTREAIMAVSPELADVPYTFLIERVWSYSKS